MADETDGGVAGTAVPYDRFQQVVTAKNESVARVTDLESQIVTLTAQAASVDALTAQVAEWQSKAAVATAQHQTYQAVTRNLGTLEQEAVDAAQWAYSRLPDAGRPEIGAWLAELRADPATAPKVLSPWLAPTSTVTATQVLIPVVAPVQIPVTAPVQIPPRGTSVQAQAPGAPSAISPEAMKAAVTHGKQTNDWSKYRELAKIAGYRK